MNFCSRHAHDQHEPLAGTAPFGRAYVFLPVEKKWWRSAELNPSWASPAELDAIRRARTQGVVTRLYNPLPAAPADQLIVHAAPGLAPPEGLAELLAAFEGRWPQVAPPASYLAICTHGTRDRCCAKWGFAAYRAALRLFLDGASPFLPLESSHLGGDRFAATGVFFPAGSMYAHLDSQDLGALAEAEAAGRIVPEAYRGCVFEPSLVQVVRAGLARTGALNDVRTAVSATFAPEDAGQVDVRFGDAHFRVSLQREEVSFFGTCEQLERGRRSRQTRMVYAGAKPV